MVLYLCSTAPADQPMGHLSHLQFLSFHATGLSTHGLPFASGYTPHARLHACTYVCLTFSAVRLKMCSTNVRYYVCGYKVIHKLRVKRNPARHRSLVERRLKTHFQYRSEEESI